MEAKDVFEKTEEQLIKDLLRFTPDNVILGELTRRNTKEIKDNTNAIKNFNCKSSILSWVMIIFAFLSIVASILIRYLPPYKVNNL